MRRFLAATSRLSTHEAGRSVGLSHEAIRKYRDGNWKQLQAASRRKLEDYLSGVRSDAVPEATLSAADSDAIRIIEKIRQLVAVPEAPNVSAVDQPAEIQPSETKPLGVAMLEGYQNNPKKQQDIRERFGNHELVLVAYVHARMLGMVARGELGQSDWDRWDGYTIGKDYFPDEGLGPVIPPEEADEFERVTKTTATE